MKETLQLQIAAINLVLENKLSPFSDDERESKAYNILLEMKFKKERELNEY